MRVAHVVGRYAPHVGGIETHVRELSRRTRDAGHAVEVLTTDDGTLPAVAVVDRVAVRRFPRAIKSEAYSVSPALWSYLRHACDFDVVHVHGYHSTSSLLAAHAVRAPFVFSSYFHGSSDDALRALLHVPYRRAGAAIFRRADAVVCLTEAEAALVGRYFPGAAGKISLISSGVDPALPIAAPMPRSAWGGGPLVLTAGRLVAYKHVEQVVAALDALPAPFALRVTGDGPARATAAAAIARLRDPARAELLGWVPPDALARWYRAADVVVSLSHHESQGITLLEALAAGAAIVAALPRVPVGVPTWDDVAVETLALYQQVARTASCRSVKARTDATQPHVPSA